LLKRARPSRYGKLRKEPHRAGLSTIEAAVMPLAKLEGNPKIEVALNVSFAKMLERVQGRSRSYSDACGLGRLVCETPKKALTAEQA
jgi:DTW domain-containing protein YfiP